MSNPESFIDEVSEEVRRDRVTAALRRWGWIPVVAVVAFVAVAAYLEWQKAQNAARAQAFGNAVIAALDAEDLPARRTAIAAIEPVGQEQAAIQALLNATTLANGEDGDAAAARDVWLALADMPELLPTYRDLALLKVILSGGTGDAARDGQILEALATPGAPYRALAVEQQALAAVRADDTATAITLLRVLSQEAGVTETLRRRAVQLIVALGGTPEPV
ncbi:hypothetical protein [Jannaschia sp. 2305UL9-9]|uniref:hypothetical protein n=1 Tax=Jannaschia sp. 2305UL9-9 TaxID=3121638 RepID=UPI003529CB46